MDFLEKEVAGGRARMFLDSVFKKAVELFTKSIRRFTAFFFFVFAAGTIFGLYFSAHNTWVLLIPPVLGLMSFYDTDIATVSLIGILFLMFL